MWLLHSPAPGPHRLQAWLLAAPCIPYVPKTLALQNCKIPCIPLKPQEYLCFLHHHRISFTELHSSHDVFSFAKWTAAHWDSPGRLTRAGPLAPQALSPCPACAHPTPGAAAEAQWPLFPTDPQAQNVTRTGSRRPAGNRLLPSPQPPTLDSSPNKMGTFQSPNASELLHSTHTWRENVGCETG